MAGNLNYHPAPGLSEIMGGWYVVPQNPIVAREYGTTYTPSIGEILNGGGVHFNVPQNPLKDYVTGGVKPLGQSGCGCGCSGKTGGCGGQINGMGVGDMSSDFNAFTGAIGSGNVGAALQQPIFGVPVWGWAAFAAFFLFSGGREHSRYSRGRRAYSAAREAYA